jgi:glycosyltransferase involved in cell wall biosynthesis
MSDSSRNLIVVSQTFPPEKGGNASRMHDLMQHLTDDWNVTVVAPPKCYPHGEFERSWTWHEQVEIDGITVHRLWAWQPTDPDPSFLSRIAYYLTFALHAFLWLLLNIQDHDLVMSSSPPIFTGFPVYPFATVLDIPWVLDIRDLWIDVSTSLGFISAGGVIERASKAYRSRELRAADLITVTTPKTTDELQSQYRTETPIEVVPNGVDVDRFRQPHLRRDPTIIYTGNLGHAQDLENCIRAMQYVETEDVTLRIVGDGDLREKLEQLTEAVGVTDRVEFIGFVDRDRIPPLLSTAMIGIAPIKSDPSLRYAVPTKLYEYMANGLPVIAVGTGEIEQFVSEAEGGYTADNEPRDIAAKIESLLADPDLRYRFGKNGRRHVTEHYDREAIALQLSEHLSKLFPTAESKEITAER